MNNKRLFKDKLAKTECRTPTAGRDGVTRIPAWKYDAVRSAILRALNVAEGKPVGFSELRSLAKAHMDEENLSELGSWGWHFTTVKLNMEFEGELKRVEGRSPQHLTLG